MMIFRWGYAEQPGQSGLRQAGLGAQLFDTLGVIRRDAEFQTMQIICPSNPTNKKVTYLRHQRISDLGGLLEDKEDGMGYVELHWPSDVYHRGKESQVSINISQILATRNR
jgi:hypothetical protein